MSQFDLILGDCLEVMPTLADKSVDMILCDLPYGTTACAWDVVIPLEPLWTQYKRLIKPRGAIVLFGSQPFTSALVMSNPEWFRYCWVWEKERGTGFNYAKFQPLRLTEDVCVFSEGTHTYNPQMIKLQKPYKHALPIFKSDSARMTSPGVDADGHRIYKTYYNSMPVNVLRYSRESDSAHPTQKPVDLLAYLIKTYTNPGDLVLDNCMGSGSTGCACRLNHRRFIGIEKDPDYFAIAQKRIAETQPPAITDEGVFIQPEQTSMFAIA